MRAALLAAALAAGAYAQNSPGGGDSGAQTPAELRRMASAALDRRDPARALALAGQVQPGDKDYGAAQALKARALQEMGDVKGALAAWREALKDPAQRAAATANIKLLGGRSEAGGGEEGGAPGAAAPGAASYNGLTSRDLNLVASMFRSRDASRTLAATLRKAAQGDASGMAGLRRHGIDFARGADYQRDAARELPLSAYRAENDGLHLESQGASRCRASDKSLCRFPILLRPGNRSGAAPRLAHGFRSRILR